MENNIVGWFEIPVSDMERAIVFYEKVLDVKLDRTIHNRDTQIFTTDKENVFICGDARRGQSLIKWAIGEGKLAAVAVEEYLKTK